MAIQFTRKEREIINAAFARIEYAADVADWSMGGRLRDALSYERKQRGGNVTLAKSLIVRQFDAGLNKGTSRTFGRTADELYRLSPGMATAYMMGAEVSTRESLRGVMNGWMELAQAADAAHEAMSSRILEG